MEEKAERRVFVGQKQVKHHGADVSILKVYPDGRGVDVTYPHTPGKRRTYVKVEDLTFADSSLSTSPNTSPVPELYPVGTVLTNGAGESVKVIGRFKSDVKLQLLIPTSPPQPSPLRGEGEVGGALVTDFQPSDDEPFTMTETDVTEWLAKTQPSAADTVPLQLHTWVVGQRARLLEDMPHDFSPLKEGTEGLVVKLGTGLGFKPDGLRAAVSYRSLNGKTVFILDHCELAADDNPVQPAATTPETETTEAAATNIQVLLEEIAFLKQERKSLLDNNKLLNREHDELMQAREDNGKLLAALTDTQKRMERLEKMNSQQSEMLREAVPQAVAAPERGQPHLKTLTTFGGSNGFGDVQIPHGYQIAAVTTEVYDGKLIRLIHLFGCADSPTPHETYAEKVTVEFEKPQNSFEDLLRGNAPTEAVIEFGNAEVLAAARQAAEASLNHFVSTEMPLLEEVSNG